MIIKQEDKEFEAKKDNILERPKLHTMPKGVVNIENLFDLREKFKNLKKVKIGSSSLAYEVINLGTAKSPNNINLGRSLSTNEKRAYLKLFKDYQDIFTWSYQDLKTYDTNIIQHTIPLRKDVKPFQ
jgi:hypothetical protein